MMMKCISKDEDIQLLREIHNGVCGVDSSWRSIVGKAFMHGFYWPTAKDDAMEIVTKCKECPFFQKQTTKYANPLRPINLSWPFAVWGIDIVDVLSRAPGGFRFLFVGIDTFTKWMEATSVVNITQEAAVKFIQSIIYRFGVPQRVLTDNGTQFKGAKFLRCCADFGIHHQPSSAVHPQTNGQVERTNGLLLQGMKTRMFQDLEAKDKNWHKELPSVLWRLRTNVSRATRATPFSLVYGAEAVLPPEVYLESDRVAHFNPEDQAEARELDANLLEKKTQYNTIQCAQISDGFEEVLQKERGTERAQHRGPSTEERYSHQRQVQVFNSMGMTVHHSGCHGNRGLCVSRS
jgi:transposase InsO family protein